MIEDADDCIAAKLAWPHLVAGYDIGSSEGLGEGLGNRLPELFWFRKQCALEGVNIPFFFRAADCPSGNADDGLFDALLLGARRIANAPSLPQHPRLLEAIKDKRILVEGTSYVTPGSNHSNPLLELLARGVSCVLSDDEVGIQSGDSSRMSDIFWHALHGWNATDLATLGSMAENSVRWAAFEDQDAETWYVWNTPSLSRFLAKCQRREYRCLRDPARAPPPTFPERASASVSRLTNCVFEGARYPGCEHGGGRQGSAAAAVGRRMGALLSLGRYGVWRHLRRRHSRRGQNLRRGRLKAKKPGPCVSSTTEKPHRRRCAGPGTVVESFTDPSGW